MNRVGMPTALALLVLISLSFGACGQEGSSTDGQKSFTADELATFDGTDGRPAYVAVDGVIYDVSGSRMWPEGAHARCDFGATAGQDLSEVIKKAPANMRALLEAMPVVGRLAE